MRTALIIGDVQHGIVDTLLPESHRVLHPLAAALSAARRAGVPRVFVRAALRADAADVPARNGTVAWMFEQGPLFQESAPHTAVHSAIAPGPGETVLVKRRGSAFVGTDLDAILRARGIDTVVLAGVATSGVVLHTLIDALDRDLAVTVLRDGCADPEPDVHTFLLERLFPSRGATVLDAADWTNHLEA